jgi:hypothetical protein
MTAGRRTTRDDGALRIAHRAEAPALWLIFEGASTEGRSYQRDSIADLG